MQNSVTIIGSQLQDSCSRRQLTGSDREKTGGDSRQGALSGNQQVVCAGTEPDYSRLSRAGRWRRKR